MGPLKDNMNNTAAETKAVSSIYMPALQVTEGQPPPIAANGGLSYMSFDKNGDGQLSSNELPARFEVAFSRGTASLGPRLIAIPQGARRPKQRAPQPGPKWFSGMDRNGDGDVSLKEFLGKPTQFNQLDTNGDGFIELKEAEAAEKEKR